MISSVDTTFVPLTLTLERKKLTIDNVSYNGAIKSPSQFVFNQLLKSKPIYWQRAEKSEVYYSRQTNDENKRFESIDAVLDHITIDEINQELVHKIIND